MLVSYAPTNDAESRLSSRPCVRHNALENWPSQDFLTTAGQWSSTLSKLSIHLAAAYISDQGMSELLASLPNLEHLVVGLEGLAAPNVSSTSFVKKLAITDSDIMVVLPKLRKFTLTLSGIGVPTRMEKVEEFLRMAETRCRERIQNGTVVASLMTSRVTYFCSTQYHTMKSNDLTHKLGLDVIQRLSALEEVGAKCIIEGDINTTSSLL
ncbi:hypothetical protein VNI00_014621 [Paramarasmius palmivorus]|uniref:Uncharacterized protein n=1 Tax=Paramarasmius palmivorus TaxID=297713 RepID=A0AAW0BRV7_9AGAR